MDDEEMLEAIAEVMQELDDIQADFTLEDKTRHRAALAYDHLEKAYSAIRSLEYM